MRYLRQGTAINLPIGPFFDSSTGLTPQSGLTITKTNIRLEMNGAGWANIDTVGTLAYQENGFYLMVLDATDTANTGMLRVVVAMSGARMVVEDFMILSQAAFDSLFNAMSQYRLKATVSVTSTAGTTAHVKVQMVDQHGAIVNITGLGGGSPATCAATVIADGGATQFSLTTTNFGTCESVGWFEAAYSNPSFTGDTGYTIEVTVIANGVTYTGSSTFFVVP